MTLASTGACVRCHSKKIRCSGFPQCHNCINALEECRPHFRQRRNEHHESLRQAKQRIDWLEDQIYQKIGIDCKGMQVGTEFLLPQDPSNATVRSDGLRQADEQDPQPSFGPPRLGPQQHREVDGNSNADTASGVSLLTLNATGDSRYLGPSSGAFFATHAAALAKSCAPKPDQRNTRDDDEPDSDDQSTIASAQLSPGDVRLLLRSYLIWVQPLYPLLTSERLEALVSRCEAIQGETDSDLEMTIFFLVMALGAVNCSNTIKYLRLEDGEEEHGDPSTSGNTPSFLYSKALQHLDREAHNLQPTMPFIQIVLLICVYSSSGPIESSQWQLAGLAMRLSIEIGLHYSPRALKVTGREADERNRVFWTAYVIEISLAYNLGRPPSIGEEHITAELPINMPETSMCNHHIKHRQIQSRIISQVYSAARASQNTSDHDRESILFSLQEELELWRADLAGAWQVSSRSGYPYEFWDRLYHGTSFVLHRSSPLCPEPSPQSLQQCIRSAGTYIDNIIHVLRESNVPLSWMLVQGVAFAGLTMLITARSNYRRLLPQIGMSFFFVEFAEWTRKCSVCLAIMNERWNEPLLAKVDLQFDSVAKATMSKISSGLMTQQLNTNESAGPAEGTSSEPYPDLELPIQDSNVDQNLFDNVPHANLGDVDWQNLDVFGDLFGNDSAQVFWDLFPLDFDSPGSRPVL